MSRRQPFDPLEDRPRLRHPEKRQVPRQRLRAHRSRKLGQLQQRLRFGRERQPSGQPRHVQRLDAEVVPGQEERVLPTVPNGHGEHPVEAPQALGSPLPVGGQHDLGVAPRAEAPALGDQLPPKLGEVVHFPVVGDREPSVVGGHGHVGVLAQVLDRQPGARQPGPAQGSAKDAGAGPVGPPVAQHGDHPVESVGSRPPRKACYPAHGPVLVAAHPLFATSARRRSC